MSVSGRSVRVKVQARTFRCEGDVVVPAPGGYKGRVLDHLNADTGFVALTDVDLYRGSEGTTEDPVTYDVILLRKGEIEFVVPSD